MTLAKPLTWDKDRKLLLDGDGNSISPEGIVNRLMIYDDLVRAVELLYPYLRPDTPEIVIQDVERTRLQVKARA